MDLRTLLFTFDGRINLAKYWLGVLTTFAAVIAAGIIFGILYAVAGQEIGTIVGGLVGLAAFAIGIWASIAIMAKRLHDREKSAWWILLFWVVPLVLNIFGQAIGGVGLVLSVASIAISIWAFVEIGCLKGTIGPNMYGPDPLPAEAD